MSIKENIISHKISYSNVQPIPVTSVDGDSTYVHQWNCCSLLEFLVECAFWLMIHIISFPSEWWNLCQLICVWCRGVWPPIILYPNISQILQATYVWRRLDTMSECENVTAIIFLRSHQQFSYVIRTVNIHWFQCYFLCWSHSLRGSLDEPRGSILAAVLFLIFSTSNASVWIHEVLSLLVFAVYGASPAKLRSSFWIVRRCEDTLHITSAVRFVRMC